MDELEVRGKPPQRLRVWATLHFLPTGSPFCCAEPLDHVPLFGEYLDRINDVLQRRMGILQEVSIDFVAIKGTACPGVEFDNPFKAATPLGRGFSTLSRRCLGRTALMRAAVFRGYDRQVEELLAAGADPSASDRQRHRGILQQIRKGSLWIRTMLEDALAERRE